MATKTEIANMALIRIGETKLLTDVDSQTTNAAAIAVNALWNTEREALLRDFNWTFARKYAPLTLETGTLAVPATPDFIFNYTYPADAVFVRRLVTCKGRQDCSPPPFQIGRSISGGSRVVQTNLEDAMAEYTVDITNTSEFDENFVQALTLKLAMRLAPGRSRIEGIVEACKKDFDELMTKAASRSLAESEYAIPTGDPQPRIRDLFNLALTRIGIVRSGVTVDPEAHFAVCWPRVCFHDERDFVLRSFPWPFATKYATLELIAGTVNDPVNDDWAFAYRIPDDCLFARRLTTCLGRKETHPPKFRIGSNYALENDDEDLTITLSTATNWGTTATITLTASEDLFSETEVGNTWRIESGADAVEILITTYVSATVVRGTPSATVPSALRTGAHDGWTKRYDGKILFTNEEDAKLEYTRESEDPDEWDAMMFSALAWRVAELLAPSVARGKNAPQVPFVCSQQYQLELDRAARAALNEGQAEDIPDAEWVAGR